MKVGVLGSGTVGRTLAAGFDVSGDVNVLRIYCYSFFIRFMSGEALTVR
jgi:hypothetical protein